jgi:transposase InsO family protein
VPWKERKVEEERLRFVAAWLSGAHSKSELCRAYGVSRKTGYGVVARFAEKGADALRDGSHEAHTHPNATPPEIVARIEAARRAHPTWGGRKLRVLLRRSDRATAWPVRSTFDEILWRAGLVVPRRQRRQFPGPERRACIDAEAPNDSWSVDFKGWFRVGDGTRCDPLTLTDNFSRYLLLCKAVARPRFAEVQRALEAVMREHGLPLALRSDNGPPFSSCGLAGLSRLAVWLVKLGVRPDFIQPGKPQQNGRHERMHRTLKAETAKPPRETIRAQQRAFDRFRGIYNDLRPHQALDDHTPAALYMPSSRPFPRTLTSVTYDTGVQVRSVRHNGCVKWAGQPLFLSEALAGEHVAFSLIGEDVWLLRFSFLDLAVLDGFNRKLHPAGWAKR